MFIWTPPVGFFDPFYHAYLYIIIDRGKWSELNPHTFYFSGITKIFPTSKNFKENLSVYFVAVHGAFLGALIYNTGQLQLSQEKL